MSKILVTGGAGYIGSHVVLALNRAGHETVVLDNLSAGRASAVLPPARLVVGDLADRAALARLFRREKFDAIIHLAASVVSPESVEKPVLYYENNAGNTISLVRLALEFGVSRFIFSSSASVYGQAPEGSLAEDAPLAPTTPYGRSKLMSEWAITDAAAANPGFRYLILRYFNVAGADPQCRIGQSSPNATHLVKKVCRAILGLDKRLVVYGTDYDTPDGTCIRDYIHVCDLADVHVSALGHLDRGKSSGVFNCGYGRGVSVLEVVRAARKAGGIDFKVEHGPRRPGDVPRLTADTSRFESEFGWKPRYDDLEMIIGTALRWEIKLQTRGRCRGLEDWNRCAAEQALNLVRPPGKAANTWAAT